MTEQQKKEAELARLTKHAFYVHTELWKLSSKVLELTYPHNDSNLSNELNFILAGADASIQAIMYREVRNAQEKGVDFAGWNYPDRDEPLGRIYPFQPENYDYK